MQPDLRKLRLLRPLIWALGFTMLILELRVNGNLVSTAGAEDLSVLGAHVTALGKLGDQSFGTKVLKDGIEFQCELTGLTSRAENPQNVHLCWFTSEGVGVGDEICISIKEANSADSPKVPTEKTAEQQKVSNEKVERQRFESARDTYFLLKDKYET
jgi:hypothetical protein